MSLESRRESRPNPPGLPNVLLILTDDWGWPFYGFMKYRGLDVFTPNLDKLVYGDESLGISKGLAFSRGYVTAAHCQPSHKSTLTGLNLRDIGNGELGKGGIKTIPDILGETYARFSIGKWWQGPIGTFFPHNKKHKDNKFVNFAREGTSDVLALVGKFFDEAAASEKPWFLWCAPNLPHMPAEPPLEFVDPNARVPEEILRKNQYGLRKTQQYLGNIKWLDQTIGLLIDRVRASQGGALTNTLVICLADNGAGLQGSKAHFSEAGMRTPIVVNFGNHIKKGGSVDEETLVGCIDLCATICDYAQVSNARKPKMPDSKSLRDRFEGAVESRVWRDVLFSNWKVDGEYAAQTTRYKLYINNSDKRMRYFDVQADPFEDDNLLLKSGEVRPKVPDRDLACETLLMLEARLLAWKRKEGAAAAHA